MLTYKGYNGWVIYDDEARIFHGEVVGLKTVITFQGTTVDEIEQAFQESIDVYLEWCEERGKEPEKAHSGKLNLRLTPELYFKISAMASQQHMSMNAYIISKLEAA